MIKWIARHLPRKLKLEVAEQFLTAVVTLSHAGMDTTIAECHTNLKFLRQMEEWVE